MTLTSSPVGKISLCVKPHLNHLVFSTRNGVFDYSFGQTEISMRYTNRICSRDEAVDAEEVGAGHAGPAQASSCLRAGVLAGQVVETVDAAEVGADREGHQLLGAAQAEAHLRPAHCVLVAVAGGGGAVLQRSHAVTPTDSYIAAPRARRAHTRLGQKRDSSSESWSRMTRSRLASANSRPQC